jgi:hypothetical protein
MLVALFISIRGRAQGLKGGDRVGYFPGAYNHFAERAQFANFETMNIKVGVV